MAQLTPGLRPIGFSAPTTAPLSSELEVPTHTCCRSHPIDLPASAHTKPNTMRLSHKGIMHKQNAKLEHPKGLNSVVLDLLSDCTELFK
jgi:hypothetical protein